MLPSDIAAKINECANTDFAGTRDWWFSFTSWATAFVALGLVLEAPELVHGLLPILRKILAWLKKSPIESSKDKTPDWVKVVAFAGWLLIVGGVVGEHFGGIRVNNLDADIQECSDAKVRAATMEAGDAAISAKIAHDDADAVSKESDAIRNHLSTASKQLTVIEETIRTQGPRWLILANNAAKFIRDLKPFGGSRITVLVCGGGVSPIEQLETEQRLLSLLGKPGSNWAAANWETGYENWRECPNSSSNGLEMAISGNASEGLKKAAKALRDQLLGLGIATSLQTVPPEQEQFWAALPMGADSLQARAARDPTTIFLLVAPNTMVEAAKPSTKSKALNAHR